MRIFNDRVYGLETSIVASGYPMRDVVKEFTPVLLVKDSIRARKLGRSKSNSGHDCYLKGIVVQADIEFPLYWLKQFQRYHFVDIVSSQSTMHRILSMNIKEHCNKWVDEEVIDIVNKWITLYNDFDNKLQEINNNERLTFKEASNIRPQDKIYIEDKKKGGGGGLVF